DEVGVAGLEPVGREELAEGRGEIHEEEKRAGDHREPVAAELPPHHAPLRGQEVAFLLRRHRLDRIRVAGRRRGVVRQALVRGDGHRPAPPARRIRGSSAASARSERKTPITVSAAMNMRNEPARYMSWLRSASSSMGPVVGSDSTTETTAAPEMSSGRSEPMSAMNGLSAMRNGYLTSALTGWSPLARAVVTYCFCSSSRRLARSRRIMPAVRERPSTIVGSQRCSSTERNFATLQG